MIVLPAMIMPVEWHVPRSHIASVEALITAIIDASLKTTINKVRLPDNKQLFVLALPQMFKSELLHLAVYQSVQKLAWCQYDQTNKINQ